MDTELASERRGLTPDQIPQVYSKLHVTYDILKVNMHQISYRNVHDMLDTESNFIVNESVSDDNSLLFTVCSQGSKYKKYNVSITPKEKMVFKFCKRDKYKNFIFKCECEHFMIIENSKQYTFCKHLAYVLVKFFVKT